MSVAIGHVGCGHWGKNLVRNFAELGVLAAVSDAQESMADAMAQQFQVPRTSFEALLRDPGIDAVSLATPAPTHAAMALAALDAGKHVFVEKPLALGLEDARQLIAAAEARGLVLMVGHLMQYHPQFLALRDIVASGRLGKLQYIHSNRLSLGKLRVEENVLWSFAPHDISMVLALAAEEPDAVTAEGAAVITPGIADHVICHMRFPSGLRGHVQTSWLHPFKEQRLVVVGEKAMAVLEDSEPDWAKRLAIYPHRVVNDGASPVLSKGEPEYVVVDKGEPLRSECQHFIECCSSGVKSRTDGHEGLRVLHVLQRAEVALSRSLGDVRL